MEKQDKYFFKTGNVDRERLTIVNRLYNPNALQFLIKSGLKEGMTILEIGSGTGHMAVELAKIVGPKGKVIASDNSLSQLEVAASEGIKNIEFKLLDINRDIDQYKEEFDLVYGRWIIEFSQERYLVIYI